MHLLFQELLSRTCIALQVWQTSPSLLTSHVILLGKLSLITTTGRRLWASGYPPGKACQNFSLSLCKCCFEWMEIPTQLVWDGPALLPAELRGWGLLLCWVWLLQHVPLGAGVYDWQQSDCEFRASSKGCQGENSLCWGLLRLRKRILGQRYTHMLV